MNALIPVDADLSGCGGEIQMVDRPARLNVVRLGDLKLRSVWIRFANEATGMRIDRVFWGELENALVREQSDCEGTFENLGLFELPAKSILRLGSCGVIATIIAKTVES